MRIAALEINPTVVARPGTVRPIRLRVGTITLMFTEPEALELANQLADATEELNRQETQQ